MSKLWGILGATIAVVISVGYLLKYFGFVANFSQKGVLIALASILAVWLKLGVQHAVFGELLLYKQGYDFCIITLGTALTSVASEWFGASQNRLGALFSTFVIAVFATLVTAKNAKGIEEKFATELAAAKAASNPAPKFKERIPSVAAFIGGVLVFMMNVSILLTK